MASQLAKGLNGSDCIIKIGEKVLAYGSSISFSEDMANQVIGSLGSGGPLALEPTAYTGGSGSFTISRYAVKDAPAPAVGVTRPKTLTTAVGASKDNSFYNANAFSPARLLMDCTFDIIIEHKSGSKGTQHYKLVDCLLTGFDISFNPGGISSESMSFECLMVIDTAAEPNKK